MKHILLLVICFYLVPPLYSQHSRFIKVSNNRLTDAAGKTVYLNGVNLGGWLLWEGWIFGGGFIKESVVKDRLRELLGDKEYGDFLLAFYNAFVTENDIRLIAQSGFNSIRLPFNYRLFTTGNNGIDGFKIIDNVVGWCKKYKILLVLDMHSAPGGQSPYFIADPADETLWQSDENKRQTLQVWLNIAERYHNETIIAGYDLLNEPDVNKQETLVSFCQDLVKAIRVVDTNHLLIVEGNKLAKNFNGFPERFDGNQIYSFHYYPWFAEKNKANNLKSIITPIKTRLPLWCGEWGEDSPDNLREVRDLFNQQANLCGTAFWTWKRVYKNNNRKPLYSIRSTPNWDRIMRWATWKILKPNKEQVQKGVGEFLHAILVENCIENPEVKDAVAAK